MLTKTLGWGHWGKEELCPSAAASSFGSGCEPRSGRPGEEEEIARVEKATAGTRAGRNGTRRQVNGIREKEAGITNSGWKDIFLIPMAPPYLSFEGSTPVRSH
jgi:hypothetical protein